MVAQERVWIRVPALSRMVEAGVSFDDVLVALKHGLVIEHCAKEKPYPRRLLLAFIGGQPIHLVVFNDAPRDFTMLAAVYRPSAEHWQALFTRRIEP